MLLTNLRVLFQHGSQYIKHLDRVKLCDEFRGRPVLRSAGLTAVSGRDLCRLCPTGAIEIGSDGLRLDMGRCLFCGECAVRYPNNVRFTNDYRLGSPTREALVVSEWEEDGVWNFDQRAVRPEIKRLFGRSLQLREVSAGGDNSCEMELGAAGNVNFDMGRYGIGFTASPRHADGVVVTGPITENMARELESTWQAVPEPKILIAVGTDAISGGLFAESPAVNRAFFDIHRPDLYVPGNPAHPMTFITGVLALVERDRTTTPKDHHRKAVETAPADKAKKKKRVPKQKNPVPIRTGKNAGGKVYDEADDHITEA